MMERRLQLLLDQQRYERVASEAERQGRSVAAVIRDAIDVAYPSTAEARSVAIEGLLTLVSDEPSDQADRAWDETRAAMEAELIERHR